MNWRALLFLAISQLLIVSVAQTGRHPRRSPVTQGAAALVDEGAAKATLEKDAIRVILPLGAATKPVTEVVLWLESPKDVRSGEIVATLSADGKTASAVLPWPKDAKGKPEEDVGWYRVGYRVESNGAENVPGMVSIGAIATNLMDLRLAYSKLVVQGNGISARVIAVNPVTGRALAGVRLKATLSDEDDTEKKPGQTRTSVTGRNGEAILTFASMGSPGDTLDLTVEGTMTGAGGAQVRDSVVGEVEVQDLGSVHVEMDKPLHKPGETVHLRAVAFRDGGRVLADEPVTVTVTDPDNKTLVKASAKTNRFGVVAYDWKTSEQTATGDYEVKFDLDSVTGGGGNAEQEVRIQRYELPEFRVAATPDKAFYLAGDSPKVKIHAEYLFGKPVSAGSVRLVRADNAEWNPKTGRYDEPKEYEGHAALDANGEATLNLKVEEESDRLRGDSWERYRDVEYRALITDSTTGRTEPRNFTVRLTKEPVHIYLNPIGSDERYGEYILSTSFADGTPAPCRVTLDWMDDASHATRAAKERTNRYGLAKVTLHFPLNTKGEPEDRPRLRITARDSQDRVSHFDDELSTGSEDNIWLSLTHSVLRPGEPIEGTVHAASGTEVDLDIVSQNAVLSHWQTRVSGTEQPFSIPASPAFHGVITVRAYNLRGTRGERRWYGERDGSSRSVLYPEDRALSATVKGLADTYSPGARVSGQLLLRSADKGPAAGAFGVSVFDTAVEQRAETEAEANDRWYGGGWWWLDQVGVGDVTLESLNKTDTGKPVDFDLDLAAEAILMNQGTGPIAIESNDDSDVRNQYQKQMEAAVKPLGEAILAAAPPNLPASLDELRPIAAAAKLDGDVLIDPWNVPYKVEIGEGWHTDVVTLRSAGPDKKFGTEDDFTLQLVQRNVFAIPGARLNDLLIQAQDSGRPLPGTTDGLKALARDGGLDLDSAAQHTLDRKGKPYVHRRSQSARPRSGGIDILRGTRQGRSVLGN
ncbi:MAG TPA: MG2 domain-containing protein [Terracidiphilus sp.]|nr:MG2 domain-containing protein [Terracidiphilus sp.]